MRGAHTLSLLSLYRRLLSSNYFPQIRYEAVVLCDPMTFDIRRAGGGVVLSEGSKGRRDIWSSKEDAYATLKSRPAWEIWDDRVLRLYAVRRFFLFIFSPPLCGGTNRADVGEGDEVASDCVLPRQDPGRHAGVQSGSGNSAFPPLFPSFSPSSALRVLGT